MRKLALLAVLVAVVVATGCAQSGIHSNYMNHMTRWSYEVDQRAVCDDVHNAILLDDRPSHLTHYAN